MDLSNIDIKDRLAFFFHWGDKQTLLVSEDHSIDMDNIIRWAKEEGHEEKAKQFVKILRN